MHDLGLSGKQFTLEEASTGYNAGPTSEAENRVDLSSGLSVYKFRVARELGRLLTRYKDAGGLECNTAYLNPGFCDAGVLMDAGDDKSYNFMRMMYQATAGCEGVADFYASLVWNQINSGQYDCQYRYEYYLDATLNGVNDHLPSDAHDCLSTGRTDWLQYFAVWTPDYPDDCSADISNRGTREDWLEYFWELAAIENVPVSTIWDTWDDADPYNWLDRDLIENVDDPDDLPIERMDNQAWNNGFRDEHRRADDEGVDH